MASKPQLVDLDFNKAARILNVLLHNMTTGSVSTTLSVDGQFGYDSDTKRIKYFDATSIRTLLTDADLQSDFTAPSTSKGATSQAIVNYFSALAASGIDIRGSINKTGSYTAPISFPVPVPGSYPTTGLTQTGNGSGTSNAIQKGNYWYITGFGAGESTTMGATNPLTVSQGALVIARIDNPTNNGNDWLVVSNVTGVASTTVSGLILLATQAKVDAGTDNASAVTPLLLANAQPQTINGGFAKRKVVSGVSLTANTAYVFNHGLNNPTPDIQVRNSAGQKIEIADTVTDANNVSIISNISLTGVSIIAVG